MVKKLPWPVQITTGENKIKWQHSDDITVSHIKYCNCSTVTQNIGMKNGLLYLHFTTLFYGA